MNVRTRMAPSPTGEYHIGHIRTVLFNYALARKHKGSFIIRIEDTDRTRFVEGATERILNDIHDYGLSWDEGPNKGGKFAPYTQSERLPLYKEYAQQLVDSGHAYYCFCDKDRLDSLRDSQREQGIPPKYDKHCVNLSKDEVESKLESGIPYVIRLNVPENQEIEFNDIIYGKLTFDSNLIDDQVLLKSDGFPTYHLAVVVDDHLMEITHVLRGNDWLPSAPKHVLLYKFFGWDLPQHAHLPNLKEKDGSKKLSKRFGSVFARQFLEEGYLPEALLNFLMFLGWNPGTEKEIYSLEDFIDDFSLEKVHKTDLVSFDRDKLIWTNGYYIRNMDSSELLSKLEKWSSDYNVTLVSKDAETAKILAVLDLVKDRMKLLSDFNEYSSFFFASPEIDTNLLTKFAKDDTKRILESFIELFTDVDDKDWTAPSLDDISHTQKDALGTSPKATFMTLRIATTGSKATPPLFDLMAVLGKEEVINRLKGSLELLS